MSKYSPKLQAGPTINALIVKLDTLLKRDFGGAGFPNPNGWRYVGTTPQFIAQFVASAQFEREGRLVNISLGPTTENNENAYFRSPSYDMAYAFENLPEEQRAATWAEHRSLLDGFANWLSSWDEQKAT